MKSLTPRNLRKLGSLMLAMTLAVCASGCLGFEKQTLVLFFPRDGQEIHGLFIYEGLMVQREGTAPDDAKPGAKGLAEAIVDLDELVRGDAICIGSRFWRVPLKLRPKETLGVEEQKMLNLFKPYLKVSRGQFFMSDKGKLTYCQPVTLKEPLKVVAGINKHISDGVLRAKDGLEGLDAETNDIFKKFASDGQAWVKYDRGRLSATLPGTPAFFQKLRQHAFDRTVMDNILKKLDDLEAPKADARTIITDLRRRAKDAKAGLATLVQTPLSVDQRRDTLTMAIGYGDHEPFQIVSPESHQPLYPNLDKDLKVHARTLGIPFRTDVTIEEVILEFQRTGQFPKQAKE